jgi:hypothetical protein
VLVACGDRPFAGATVGGVLSAARVIVDTGGVGSGEHLEAVLEWGASGEAPWVSDWLRDRGLEPVSMRGGLLVTGDRQAFSSAFGVSMDEIDRPGSLPVPRVLDGAVASITLAGPKQIMGSHTPRR